MDNRDMDNILSQFGTDLYSAVPKVAVKAFENAKKAILARLMERVKLITKNSDYVGFNQAITQVKKMLKEEFGEK